MVTVLWQILKIISSEMTALVLSRSQSLIKP
ncbi:hypothetical protein METESE_14080 [Mesoterricola sediminis]|uniref:Uncharacterized protein n=1 Tax=Mesoterricola sediminis TaxID=2927980 RepID=A0AA48GVK8_9BACT|nr:hypothetical protein METESE_14080 [Mesoterricola sediminis]